VASVFDVPAIFLPAVFFIWLHARPAGAFLPALVVLCLSAAWLLGQRRIFLSLLCLDGCCGLPRSLMEIFYRLLFIFLCKLAACLSTCPSSFPSFLRVIVVGHTVVCMPPLRWTHPAPCWYCPLLNGTFTLPLFMPSLASRFSYLALFGLRATSHWSPSFSSVNLPGRHGGHSFSVCLGLLFLFSCSCYL
jgi:hypothetical protein